MYRIGILILAISLQANDISISEVMSNPQGSEYENEFIELYNTSDHVIHINSWVISDGTGIDSLIHLSGPRGVPAFGYAVILDPSYNFELGPYHDLMPDSTPIYTISTDATLGSGGLSNSGESVILWSPDSTRLSQMSWSRASDNGHSWERVSFDTPDSLAEWQQSLVENGTPGYRNSRERPPFNLVLESVEITPGINSQELGLQLVIRNTGVSDIDQIRLIVQASQRSELLDLREGNLLPIEAGDSLIWSMSMVFDRCGWITLEITIDAPQDELLDDNMIVKDLYIQCLESPLIINEIMPIPVADEPEWVEIYNMTWYEVDLRNWQLSDDNNKGKIITDSSIVLEAHDYLLLSTHSEILGSPWDCQIIVVPGFPTLNNSEDAVILIDPNGKTMDEMSYDENLALTEGRSWERIRTNVSGSDQKNWGVCINASASTPGYKNSLHLTQLASDLSLELDPNPFTPNADGENDVLAIQYELPFEQALVSMVIYDMAGRPIAEPYHVKAVAHRGQLIWNGEASYGGIAVTGLYICKLYIDDMQGQVLEVIRKVYLLR